MENTDSKDVKTPYLFTVDRLGRRGSRITKANQVAVKVEMNNKKVLEVFQSPEFSKYHFSLVIDQSPNSVGSEFKATFTDHYGTTVVSCSRAITFN